MTTTRKSSGLVEWLMDLAKRKDRGRLAALRRGLLLETEQFYELYRVVPAPFLEGLTRAETERRMMVAILFASHACSFSEADLGERPHNLGESLRMLAKRLSPGDAEELPESLKRRMDALLTAHEEDLFDHLRHIIRLLKSEEVPVDWDQLLSDLRNWNRADRQVQWWWSRSFYVGQ